MWLVGIGFFFFKQKTAYEVLISDWSSDVCSSDLSPRRIPLRPGQRGAQHRGAAMRGRHHRLSALAAIAALILSSCGGGGGGGGGSTPTPGPTTPTPTDRQTGV